MDEELDIMRDAVRKFLSREFVHQRARRERQGGFDRDAGKKGGAGGRVGRKLVVTGGAGEVVAGSGGWGVRSGEGGVDRHSGVGRRR